MNGESSSSAIVVNSQHMSAANGVHVNGVVEPTLEQLEAELPVVMDGQVPLGEILSRVTQAIYTELQELGETLPSQSDTARKRTLADWVVKTKKQVVKLYAVAKWARDADTVQKCMNITAFLMDQNHQFESSIQGLTWARQSLDPARLRNHDLLTSLDVLTTGSYRRLPTAIKKSIIPPTPLTDAEVIKTLVDIQDAIRYRLRLSEIIPIEMSHHRIVDGRVYFTAPNLFECSLCLNGTRTGDGWFFVHVEFLIKIGGDLITTQEFPRVPTGIIKRHISEEVDRQLALFLPHPELQPLPPGVELPPKQELPEDVVDTPLVRVFNFLQMMSLSYQLEILWYQAERMRALGWGDYLNVNMSPNRKILTATYWIRKPPPQQQSHNLNAPKIPLLGGTLTVAIIECTALQRENRRSFRSKTLAELQQISKLRSKRPSNTVEHLKFDIRWEPAQGALAIALPREDTVLPDDLLTVNADDLNFEDMLRKIIHRHTRLLLARLQFRLSVPGVTRSVFSGSGIISLVEEGDFRALKLLLCADKYILITIDTRTGRIILRDVGELAATNTGSRVATWTELINRDPASLTTVLVKLRLETIIDLVEQKANYLGLQSYRTRPFLPNEHQKLAPSGRPLGAVYIRLRTYESHYLVVIIADEEFQYALITTAVIPDSATTDMIIKDVAFLDPVRIHGDDPIISIRDRVDTKVANKLRNSDDFAAEALGSPSRTGFRLETQLLREIYSYCCARVAYQTVETQFKKQDIPYSYHTTHDHAPELGFIQSSIARSVPALSVQSRDILSRAPAAEAAMPNIRVIPLNWWSEKNAHVVTCVKLKYVQQPLGKTAGTSTVIRPSKRIVYDTNEAVVSFLSENIETCVDEFLEEWARVSKMVVIAREVAQMSKEKDWQDIRLISFDLQTVEFAYSGDYVVSITTREDLQSTSRYDLRFSRRQPGQTRSDSFNPHDDAERYLRAILQHGHGRLAPSLHHFVQILRDTLPIVVELEEIRNEESQKGNTGTRPLDIFPKSAGWYRLLYGDYRHALDFRLMTEQRVAIYDASHSLYDLSSPSATVAPVKTEEMVVDTVAPSADITGVFLQPIPDFPSIVSECVRQVVRSGAVPRGTIAPVDIGVVCDTKSVRALIRGIHTKVSEKLGGS